MGAKDGAKLALYWSTFLTTVKESHKTGFCKNHLGNNLTLLYFSFKMSLRLVKFKQKQKKLGELTKPDFLLQFVSKCFEMCSATRCYSPKAAAQLPSSTWTLSPRASTVAQGAFLNWQIPDVVEGKYILLSRIQGLPHLREVAEMGTRQSPPFYFIRQHTSQYK